MENVRVTCMRTGICNRSRVHGRIRNILTFLGIGMNVVQPVPVSYADAERAFSTVTTTNLYASTECRCLMNLSRYYMQQRGMATFLAALKATKMRRQQIESDEALIPPPLFFCDLNLCV